MKRLIVALLLIIFFSGPSPAQDSFPSRPVTLIVPFAAGGPTDTIARVMAEAMSKTLGQPILIENVAGAGGTIGTARTVRAAPDGHTLLIHHLGLATSATLYRNLPFSTESALAPVGLITEAPMSIIGRADFEPGTLPELLSVLKARGEKVTLANAGVGSASHLCGLMFMTAIDQKLTAIPYKGGAPLMNDLLGRQVDLACDQVTSSVGQIKARQVKAYAITTSRRLPSLPDVPTAHEAGLANFSVSVWHGLYGPRETPPSVVQKLSLALKTALADERVINRLAQLETDPVPLVQATPEALQQRLVSEIERWRPIIKSSGQFAD